MLRELLAKLKEPLADTDEDTEALLPLAAAVLYLEVAWADHDIADDELSLIRRQLAKQFSLSAEDVDEIVAESRKQHDASVGLYRFTRTINDAWDEQAKFELIHRLWQLAYSDESLDRFEEHTIRKIAELLYVSHNRFIEAKLKAKRAAER